MFIQPSFQVGTKFYEIRNNDEYLYEIEYVSQLPLGTDCTNEFMYLCKVYKTDASNLKTFSYQLVQERMFYVYKEMR